MASKPSGASWMPENASTFTGDVDALLDLIFTVNAVGVALVVVALLWIVITWHRRSDDEYPTAQKLSGNTVVGTASVLVAGLGVAVVGFGFQGALDMSTPPEGAFQIRAEATSGKWTFRYPGVEAPQKKIHVAKGQAARILLAADAPASLSIPELRVKAKATAGRYSSMWFEATRVGTFEVRGTGGAVVASLVVHAPDAFGDQLEQGFPAPGTKVDPLVMGKKLYTTKTCNACHTIDGTKTVGPTFKGLFGKMEPLVKGGPVKVDEAYLRKSIKEPAADIVKGYGPTMPAMELTDQQVEALITFIKAQK